MPEPILLNDHVQAAEDLLHAAVNGQALPPALLLATAQVHATLAVVDELERMRTGDV